MSPNLLLTLSRIRAIERWLGGPERVASGFPPSRPQKDLRTFREMVEDTARRYGLDPALVHAVVQAESGYNPYATSPVGAQGLMQLMPATARALGVRDPYDPAQNVEGGVRYLRGLLDRFGDVRLALAAYNAGPGAVERYRGVPPYPETRAYVERVLTTWQRLRVLDPGGAP
ncbi:MAG: lytic transglycosylase domain-containing protein [Armatimonadota bacterium]|nr:lytic transglycosylase domain-containing protein [Armatimonadota bacterium]MDR7439035.1 lytic transglycosylase domain-containing protein [Armatimonadota bacterium]MDR7562483.1 lytic transglycosylase domain-containing protein [Armatimonadota bacterium]MDR7566839.1 lytic transglycosylase domain-containing protein [Armatimonadota bacterium]MDR7601196.1 lytic transglycosylase domain-containing protein [Armatimonadota bacterium]